MPKWKGIIGKQFTIEEFAAYVNDLSFRGWVPEYIVLHHTAVPCLKDYPNGITKAYVNMLVGFYRDEKGWSAGPHLFVDDKSIWVFTPLTTPGVHAVSFNRESIGMEMLGNYDVESFTSGRGAKVRENAASAIAILCMTLDISPDALMFHRDDPQTDKTCPGTKVKKEEFIALVKEFMVQPAEPVQEPEKPKPVEPTPEPVQPKQPATLENASEGFFTVLLKILGLRKK